MVKCKLEKPQLIADPVSKVGAPGVSLPNEARPTVFDADILSGLNFFVKTIDHPSFDKTFEIEDYKKSWKDYIQIKSFPLKKIAN